MKILVFTQRVLQFAGIVPTGGKYGHEITLFLHYLVVFFDMFAISSYVYNSITADSLFEMLDTVSLWSVVLSFLGGYLYFAWQKSEIIDGIDDMEIMINERMGLFEASRLNYEKTNKSVEKTTTFIFLWIHGSTIGMIANVILLYIYLVYVKGEVPENLQLPFPMM